jgi:hypothetical protein
MKKGICVFFCHLLLLMIAGFMITARIGAEETQVQKKTPEFDDVLGREWKLIGIRTGAGDAVLDRAALEADGLGDIFTLKFDAERVSGRGFPNRYFGPYERDGGSLTVGNVAATLMMSFKELDVLKEREYFDYLGDVSGWDLVDGRLELYTSGPDGTAVVLIFD